LGFYTSCFESKGRVWSNFFILVPCERFISNRGPFCLLSRTRSRKRSGPRSSLSPPPAPPLSPHLRRRRHPLPGNSSITRSAGYTKINVPTGFTVAAKPPRRAEHLHGTRTLPVPHSPTTPRSESPLPPSVTPAPQPRGIPMRR
jgi:hypothetical protein